jgi:hypothetical protein
MKCSMCNGFIQPKNASRWTVTTPQGEKFSICGRCYVLTAILDNLVKIANPKEKPNG